MKRLFRGAWVFLGDRFFRRDVSVADGRIERIGEAFDPDRFDQVFSLDDCFLVPGFLDVHVHLREPGFLYKGTIATETLAAARGGYTHVCAMPNLVPAPDSLEHLQVELDAIARDARVRVTPYGRITKDRDAYALADYAAMRPYVAGYSDDGRGVQNESIMLEAMEHIAAVNGLVAAHCEDDALVKAGKSAQAEWRQIARDIALVEKTRCRYHVCHVSTEAGVSLVRDAKMRGLPVTCETAPHYLLLDDGDVLDDGRFKMNPQIRTRADREALVEGLLDGTVDCVATDHAPHAAHEKDRGFAESVMGVVGLECAFAALYTGLVLPGRVPLETLIRRMTYDPARVLGVPCGIVEGYPADMTVLDLHAESVVEPADFVSMGRSTPFAGRRVRGQVKLTVCKGEIVWQA